MRQELEGLQRKRTAPVAQVRRAKLILLLDQGASRGAIMDELGCDSRFIATWKARFSEERLAGLYGRHPGRAPRRNLPRPEARVLDYTLKRKPRDGSAHWSSRKLAAELGISFMDVQRIWRRHELRPHRPDRHMVSNDPDFEAKAADVIGLYLSPPAHAAVFCVDEKGSFRRWIARTSCCPCRRGVPRATASSTSATARSACCRVEYGYRGSLGQDGGAPYQRPVRRLPCRRHCEPAQGPRDSSHLRQREQPYNRRCRCLSGRSSDPQMHFTLTYSSWLNQVDDWFGRIQRDVIARGIFTSTKDLDKKIMHYIRQYNQDAKPLKWKYTDPTRRIRCNSSVSAD